MAVPRIFLELDGSEADEGISLAGLEHFMKNLRRALVDFDRSRTGRRIRREGRREAREEAVTAFRVVGLRAGSTQLELKPEVSHRNDGDLSHERFDAVELLPAQNLRVLIDAIESSEPLEPAVTEALEAARSALGDSGRIGVVFTGKRGGRRREVVIDAARVDELRQRNRRVLQTVTQINGYLHMVDVDPFRIGVRTTTGVEWICEYEPELESMILDLIKSNVVARGHGILTSANRGDFRIEAIEAISDYEQTELFTVERKPLGELLADHDIAPQGWDVFADPDWEEDAASERFVDALLNREPR